MPDTPPSPQPVSTVAPGQSREAEQDPASAIVEGGTLQPERLAKTAVDGSRAELGFLELAFTANGLAG